MTEQEKSTRRTQALNVVSNKEHRGFGAGAIDLNSVSAVIIDGEEAYVDLGALHAKSKIEKGVKFSADVQSVPQGRRCWIVWVAVDKTIPNKPAYAGVAACEMTIDAEARRGWKVLADHVNRMDYAMKRRVLVEALSPAERLLLRTCLIQHNRDLWEHANETFKQALAGET